METGHLLYTSCESLEHFWREARRWTSQAWGVAPPLTLKCNRLLGMENERPDDLRNIFYRNVRYTIYKGRETRHKPSIQLLEDLMLEDLKRKYAGGRVEKYINLEEEQLAISWFQQKMNLDPVSAIG